MDFKQIIEMIKNFAALLKEKLKVTMQLPYARLYLLISLALIVLFTILTFPYNILIKNELQNIEKYSSGTVSVGDIDFNIIGDSAIDRLQLEFSDGSELRMHDITLNFNSIRIFINYLLQRDLNFDGSISINSLKYISEKYYFNGTVNGNVDIYFKQSPVEMKSGSLTFIVQNASIKLDSIALPEKFGGLNIDIPQVHCPSVVIDIIFDEKSIMLKKLNFSGTELRGSLTGSISRSKYFKASSLNLILSIDESSTALGSYKMLLGKMITNNKLDVRIKGSIAQPSWELNQ